MGKASDTYVQQLEHHGYGIPLWYPMPPLDGEGVQPAEACMGDVGFVDDDGVFHRFFNAMVDADHSLNQGEVPDGFRPLCLNKRLISTEPHFLDAVPITSKSIKSRDIGANAGVYVFIWSIINITPLTVVQFWHTSRRRYGRAAISLF